MYKAAQIWVVTLKVKIQKNTNDIYIDLLQDSCYFRRTIRRIQESLDRVQSIYALYSGEAQIIGKLVTCDCAS